MVKKNFWKRLLALATAGVMLFSMVACNTEKKDDSNDSKEENETVENETDGDEGSEEVTADPFGAYEETVKVAIGKNADNPSVTTPDNGTFESNAVKNYAEELLNVDIEYTILTSDSSDYMRQISMAMTSGDLPDIFEVRDYDLLKELVDNDLVEDLTDEWEAYASEDLKALYAGASAYGVDCFTTATFDGKIMALPRYSVDQPGVYIHIRQDWLDALGMNVDEDGDKLITREELIEIAEKFMEEDPGNSGNPIGINATTGMGTLDLCLASINSSFGVHHRYYLQNEDGSVYYGGTVPEAKEALAWWADIYAKGILDPQFGVRDWDGVTELMVNGNTGIFMGESSFPSWLFTSLYDANPSAEFAMFGLDDGTGQMVMAQYQTVNRWVVARKGFEHPELVFKLQNVHNMLINDFASAPNPSDDLVAYNENGTVQSFDILGLANVKRGTAVQAYPEVMAVVDGKMTEEELEYPARSLPMIQYQQMYDAGEYESMTSAQKGNYGQLNVYADMYLTLAENDALVVVPTLKVITTETMKTKKADLDKFEDETWVKIITGEEPIDYFDEFVEEYNKLGGSAIIDELNAIYNK